MVVDKYMVVDLKVLISSVYDDDPEHMYCCMNVYLLSE